MPPGQNAEWRAPNFDSLFVGGRPKLRLPDMLEAGEGVVEITPGVARGVSRDATAGDQPVSSPNPRLLAMEERESFRLRLRRAASNSGFPHDQIH
jgi:hypothetical protein